MSATAATAQRQAATAFAAKIGDLSPSASYSFPLATLACPSLWPLRVMKMISNESL